MLIVGTCHGSVLPKINIHLEILHRSSLHLALPQFPTGSTGAQ
jgi:hypothetical protein